MKFNKYLICALFLVLICCIGAASAAEADDVVAADDAIDEEVTEAVDVSDEVVDDSLGVSEEPALSDGEDTSSDEGYVIYVGHNNKTETGDGSEDNPFSTLKYACDNVSGQDKVTVKIFNGTYYLGSHLQFNTSNLNIKGINGKVIVTYLYDTDEDGDHGEAFGLTSALSNFTISNIIFDGRNRSSYDAFWGPEVYYQMMGEEGSYQSFFLPFYGYANIGTFNNCSFLFGNINTRLTGAGEYKSKFINCYFDVTNNWNLLFYGGQYRDEDGAMIAGHWDVTGDILQFEYCSFNLPVIQRLVDMITLPCSIAINDSWFGQNNLPEYLGPYGGGHVAKPGGAWDFDWTVPVNRYAIFSVSENYLGNNQFEIVGKLTWNGTDSQEGMENFQPMTVTLSSDTGDIVTKAILINGTFKANYTSQAPINKITATLDSQPLELEFYNVNISADAPSIFYGQDQNLTLNFTLPIDATIVLTVSNENYNESYEIYVDNKDSIVYQIFDTLKEGTYTVDINLNDNKYYGGNSTTLTISKISNYLFDVIIPSEVKVGENATITLTLPKDVDGTVTIKFGNDIKVLDANQTMTIDFGNLNATNYDVNITYNGNDKYVSKEKIDIVSVDKADSGILIDDAEFVYGQIISIPFTAVNSTGVNVRVLKNDEEVTTTSSDSSEILIDAIDAGEYKLEVTSIVNDNYEETTVIVNLTINKAESSLNISNKIFNYGTEAQIIVQTENSTGDIIASLINDDEVTFNINVSGDVITLPILDAGKYTLTVTTNVDENHNSITKSATITIVKITPTINVTINPTENITVNDNVTITVKLPKDATGFVLLEVNNIKLFETLINGTAQFTVKNLDEKTYNINATYLGDNRYLEISNNTNSFSVIAGKPNTQNNNITIMIDGVKYTVPLVNGIATIKTNSASSTESSKITSTKKNTVIKASNKAFKSKSKTKKYTITLKSGKTPIKKVQVTIKIGKKTFKAKTNAKGKATFKIKKLTKKGKYKATIKFKGNKLYKASSKKVKITIK